MTVSRALTPRKRENDRIHPETRAVICKLAKEMGYKPNNAARSLILKKTLHVGFHINQPGFHYYSPLMQPLLQTARKELEAAGYSLGFYYFQAGNIPELENFLKPPRVDALIVLGRHLSRRETDAIEASRVPCISLFEKLERAHSILIDDHLGGRLAARFLHGRGFREAAMIAHRTGKKRWDGRIDGFLAEAKKLRMAVSEIADFHHPQFDPAEAWAHGKVAPDLQKRLQRLGAAGRCVYCPSDTFALGLLDDFDRRGVKVGREISLLGYDNSEEQATPAPAAPTALASRLTTVTRPRAELGQLIADLIINEERTPVCESFEPAVAVNATVGEAC